MDYNYDPDHRAAGRDPADAAQPVFDETEACVKCGARRLQDGSGTLLLWHRTEYRAEADMLVVTCGECGFQWARRPLDDQPCGAAVQLDMAAALGDPDPDTGKRFCSLRLGHDIEHDFSLTEDPIPTRSGFPW